MPGPPPPPPPAAAVSGPGKKRGVKFKKMSIKDFRKSDSDSDTLVEEPTPQIITSPKPSRAPGPPPPLPPKSAPAPPPPPPPPPFLGGKVQPIVTNYDYLPKPQVFKLPIKTLKIFWAPVDPGNIEKTSLWAKPWSVNENAMKHGLEKCCQLFPRQVDATKLNADVASKSTKALAERIIGRDNVMEGAAERPIEASGLTPEEIRQGVLNFEYENDELILIIRNLKQVLCKPTKVDQLKAAKDNYRNMLILDKVGILLAEIPHIETYVHWMLRAKDFDADCNHLLQHSEMPAIAIEQLMTNQGFLLTLRIILAIGNSMNAEINPRGSFGFDLKLINKLVDTKSSSGFTFLEFLVETIETDFPEAQQFWKDFTILNTGMTVKDKRDTVAYETNNLKQLLETLYQLLDVDLSAEPDLGICLHKIDSLVHAKPKSFFNNHQFVYKVLPLAKRLCDDVRTVKTNLNKADAAFSRVKTFFTIGSRGGEGGYLIDMFLGDMRQFMMSLKDAHDKIQAQRKKKETLKEPLKPKRSIKVPTMAEVMREMEERRLHHEPQKHRVKIREPKTGREKVHEFPPRARGKYVPKGRVQESMQQRKESPKHRGRVQESTQQRKVSPKHKRKVQFAEAQQPGQLKDASKTSYRPNPINSLPPPEARNATFQELRRMYMNQ